MATLVSPGIKITEVDKTLSLGQAALTEGGIAGNFKWGPVESIRTVTSEDELVKVFGKPDNNTAPFFFTAANFLAYGNSLRVVRVVDEQQGLAATSAANNTILTATATFTVNATSANLTAVSGNTAALFPGQVVYLANATANATVTISSITNSTSAVLVTTPSTAVSAGNAYAYGVYLKNEDHYELSFSGGEASIGHWAAKWIGALGNSLRVEVCAGANAFSQTPSQTLTVASGTTVDASSNVASFLNIGDVITANSESRQVTAIAANGTQFSINSAFSTALSAEAFTRKWQYASFFSSAPGTSDSATQRGGSKDELHVVVIDKDGLFTGSANTVLEKYAFVSKAADAKTSSGASNYYVNVLNRQSAYVWWMDHPTAGTNWGGSASLAFGELAAVQISTLNGGVDGGSGVVDGDLERGYDLFLDETVDISFLLGASASSTLANYLISNVIEPKQFCVGFFSPNYDSVVDNAGSEVTDITTYRNALPSSSYAVLDSGWKYQYDKYNDVYRYVPLNGDTAGCAVRTDQVSEPWFSPAGFQRGQIKNIVKLAFQPRPVDRDDLYRINVNPVAMFPGQGTVLYGDKTLQAKPSDFDRINVRRLFIALEKTVKTMANAQLFEQNDAFTRQNFVGTVEPYLRSVKGRRGISDYYVVCDESNNPPAATARGEFRASIFVKPIHSINFIMIDFVSVRGDVAFSEVITNL